jgi:hypothetical protein
MALDDDLQEVRRHKRPISNDASQTARKSTKSVPISAAVKLTPKAVLTGRFFAPFRTTDMDMETAAAENTLEEQEAPSISGRPPPILMTSTTNLIRLQSDLKEHFRGEYEFQNTRNGTCIITKEMADYSAMKSYLEKNNLHYFSCCPNFEMPIKAEIHPLPSHTPAEDISNSLEDFDFNVISVTQLTNRRATNGQTHVETLLCYLYK